MVPQDRYTAASFLFKVMRLEVPLSHSDDFSLQAFLQALDGQ